MKRNVTCPAGVVYFCVFGPLVFGCKNSADDGASTPGNYERVQFSSVRCSIELEDNEWTAKRPAIVYVKLQNVSNETIELLVRPAFEIQYADVSKPGPICWCPTTLHERAKRLGSHAYYPLSLKKGEMVACVAQVSELGWDYSFSSRWPVKGLFDLLEPGKYRIQLDMQLKGQKNTWIESNVVPFSIVEARADSSDENIPGV